MKTLHLVKTLGLLCAILSATTSHGEPPPLPPDGYVWSAADQLTIQSLEPGVSLTLPARGWPDIDVSSDGHTLCERDSNRDIRESELPWVSYRKLGVSHVEKRITPQAGRGTCFFAYDYVHLGIGRPDEDEVTTVAIRSDIFVWTDLQYLQAADLLAVVGQEEIAVVRDPRHRREIKPVRLHGEVRGLRFENLLCCSRLSPDGRTLYSMMNGTADSDQAVTALGAFDTATGRFLRFYLPYFLAPPTDFPDAVFQFDASKKVGLEGDGTQAFALSPDGKTLYVDAFYRDANHDVIVAIDTHSGRITPLPIPAPGGFGVTADGKFLIASTHLRDIAPYMGATQTAKQALSPFSTGISVFSLPDGRYVRTLQASDDDFGMPIFEMTLHQGR